MHCTLPGIIGRLDVDHDDGHQGEEHGHNQGQPDVTNLDVKFNIE